MFNYTKETINKYVAVETNNIPSILNFGEQLDILYSHSYINQLIQFQINIMK